MPVVPFNHNLIKIGKRQYRNPIYLASEWRQALNNGEYASPADLARRLKVSRARVAQIMNLLKLSPDVIEMLSSLGDPPMSPALVERRLRPLLGLAPEKQVDQIKLVLSKGRPSTL
jgi:ParB-like chromosome segregation protein Spo0J